MEDTPIKVRYRYNTDKYDELVCEITEFMDKYLIRSTDLYKTYLNNDIGVLSKQGFLQIAFRVPRSYKGLTTT